MFDKIKGKLDDYHLSEKEYRESRRGAPSIDYNNPRYQAFTHNPATNYAKYDNPSNKAIVWTAIMASNDNRAITPEIIVYTDTILGLKMYLEGGDASTGAAKAVDCLKYRGFLYQPQDTSIAILDSSWVALDILTVAGTYYEVIT